MTSATSPVTVYQDSTLLVAQLIIGECREMGPGLFKATGSVTLVSKNGVHILVDCGHPLEKSKLVQTLETYSLDPGQIDHVVCTHGHLDHVGNLNLFTKATVYLDNDTMNSDGLFMTDLPWEDGQLELSPKIKLWKTPGHTCHDLSLVVTNDANIKTIVVTGDIFECEEDAVDDKLWKCQSRYLDKQLKSRSMIRSVADIIIPGHGKAFGNKHIAME